MTYKSETQLSPVACSQQLTLDCLVNTFQLIQVQFRALVRLEQVPNSGREEKQVIHVEGVS